MVKLNMGYTKYIIKGNFKINGYIEKPDLIGSFFGQTEGLIGEDLEFSELQKKGKLGRIEINLKKNNGYTTGNFIIPTALTKVEVSLVAAALESINKISNATGKIDITEIIDDRIEKRAIILNRAEEILKNLKEQLPDTHNITENITENIKKKTIRQYDTNIFGGPYIDKQNEIILVEGRADVLNLLKHGINNVISMGGNNISKFIKTLSQTKTITAFLDDDTGGHYELNILKDTINLSYYTFAPSGKEVEELTIKEIHKALKNKIQLKKNPKTLFNKIKETFIENTPIVKYNIKKGIELTNQKINQFQEKLTHNKNTTNQKTQNNIPNLYFKKHELEKIKTKIQDLETNKEKDFAIYNNNLRCIKTGKLHEFTTIKDLNNPKYLILNAICENSIYKKSKNLHIKIIISKKKKNDLSSQIPIVKLFDEINKY